MHRRGAHLRPGQGIGVGGVADYNMQDIDEMLAMESGGQEDYWFNDEYQSR